MIDPQTDGTVDVYLAPDAVLYRTEDGLMECECMTVRIVKGVIPWPGLEADIRKRYYDWIGVADTIEL